MVSWISRRDKAGFKIGVLKRFYKYSHPILEPIIDSVQIYRIRLFTLIYFRISLPWLVLEIAGTLSNSKGLQFNPIAHPKP
jgi:hypothetical protein